MESELEWNSIFSGQSQSRLKFVDSAALVIAALQLSVPTGLGILFVGAKTYFPVFFIPINFHLIKLEDQSRVTCSIMAAVPEIVEKMFLTTW